MTNQLEGRGLVPHSFDTSNDYLPIHDYDIIDPLNSTELLAYDGYPNKVVGVDASTEATYKAEMESALTFANNDGLYTVSDFSHLFRVSEERSHDVSSSSDAVVNSSIEYASVIPIEFGSCKFNKIAIYITNVVTNQTFLFGIIYFNTNILKTKPSTLIASELSDIKFKFRVMLNADTSDLNATDMDYDNYVFFHDSASSFKAFSTGVITTTDAILVSDTSGDLKDANGFPTLEPKLSSASFISHMANGDNGGYASIYGDAISANVSYYSEQKYNNGVLSELVRKIANSNVNFQDSDLNYLKSHSTTLDEDTVFTTSTLSSVTAYNDNITVTNGVRINAKGYYFDLTDVRDSDLDLYGDSVFSSTVSNTRHSIVNGYGANISASNHSLLLGKCFTISARNSLVSNILLNANSTFQTDTSSFTSTETLVHMKGSTGVVEDDISYNTSTEFGYSATTGQVIGSSVKSMFSSIIAPDTATASIYNSTANLSYSTLNGQLFNSNAQLYYSTLSESIAMSDVNSYRASMGGSQVYSNVNIGRTVIGSSDRTDITIVDISRVIEHSGTITSYSNSNIESLAFGETASSQYVSKTRDRFFFMNLDWSFNPNSYNTTTNVADNVDYIDFGNTVMDTFKEINNSWIVHTAVSVASGGTQAYNSSNQYVSGDQNTFNGKQGYIPVMNPIDTSLDSGAFLSNRTILADIQTSRQDEYRNIWMGYEIDARIRKNQVALVTAHNDVPISYLKSRYVEDNVGTTFGSEENSFLTEIAFNMDYDTKTVEHLFNDGTKVRMARAFNGTAVYDATAKKFALTIPNSVSISELGYMNNTESFNIDQFAEFDARLNPLTSGRNHYVTISICSENGGADGNFYSSQLTTFKVSDIVQFTTGQDIIVDLIAVNPTSVISENVMTSFTMGTTLTDGDSIDGKIHVVMWSVNDAVNGYLTDYWTSNIQHDLIENKYITSISSEYSGGNKIAKYGVGRILRTSIIQSQDTSARGVSYHYGYSTFTNATMVDSSISSTNRSNVNIAGSHMTEILGSLIMGTRIKVNPTNAINAFLYNDGGTLKLDYKQNKLMNSILFGNNINLNITPVNKTWAGNFQDGGTLDPLSSDDIDWLKASQESRLKNLYFFGDSIYTFSGIYTFDESDGAIFDSGFSSQFLDNSGKFIDSEWFNNNPSLTPIHGIKDSFIRGTEIFLSSTSGALEEVNLFGRFINADHSWLTVFGRFNEWRNQPLVDRFGQDFFVVANGRGTPSGGGITNNTSVDYTSGFIRRYNMFVVTDRGITKTRTMISRGVAYRTNPSYQLWNVIGNDSGSEVDRYTTIGVESEGSDEYTVGDGRLQLGTTQSNNTTQHLLLNSPLTSENTSATHTVADITARDALTVNDGDTVFVQSELALYIFDSATSSYSIYLESKNRHWSKIKSVPVMYISPNSDDYNIYERIIIIKNLLRPFGYYGDKQSGSYPEMFKDSLTSSSDVPFSNADPSNGFVIPVEWSDDRNFYGLAVDNEGYANAVIDDNIVTKEDTNWAEVNIANYIESFITQMPSPSRFSKSKFSESAELGDWSADGLTQGNNRDINLTSVKCKLPGLYSLNGRMSIPINQFKMLRLYMWKQKFNADGTEDLTNSTINSNGQILVPEIIYDYTCGEHFGNPVVNINCEFMIDSPNTNVYISAVGIIHNSYDSIQTTFGLNDELGVYHGAQWQSDYLHLSYKGYISEDTAWSSYNGLRTI